MTIWLFSSQVATSTAESPTKVEAQAKKEETVDQDQTPVTACANADPKTPDSKTPVKSSSSPMLVQVSFSAHFSFHDFYVTFHHRRLFLLSGFYIKFAQT